LEGFTHFSKKIDMNRILFVTCLLAAGIAQAQFNPGAPWMRQLEKSKGATAKASGQRYTLPEISAAFDAYWSGRDWEARGSGFKPYKRWENYWQYFANADGYLPTARELWQAWERKADRTGFDVNPVSAWTSVGPFAPGIFAGQLPGTGRLNAVAVDPNNPDTWYVGAPAGGIWKSTDAGGTWTNLFDNFPQIGVSGIAIDPQNSDIIYIATGDDDAGDSFSVGVFRSDDGGVTWSETGLNPENTSVSTLMNEIVIDPTDSSTLWVGTTSGLFKSTDAGANWSNVQSGNIKDFKLKPGDPNTVYAVTNSRFYKSTDGETFTLLENSALPEESGRLVLGVSLADPNRVYVLSANTSAEDFSFQGLYESTNSGDSFSVTLNSEDLMESSQAWFDLALEVSPTDADELYVGCLNIWKSTDGGDSFEKLNEWFVNDAAYTHADIHTLRIFNGKLFAGTDGGLYVTEDGGETFEDLTSGMAIGQFYRLSVSGSDAGIMTGGLQDNGGQVLGAANWNNWHGGDGMDNVIDPMNNSVVYGFSQFGGVLYLSTDAGQSIGFLGSPFDDNGRRLQGNWITPLAIGPDGTVYAGYDAVYKLTGNAWEKVSLGLGNTVEDVEVSASDPQVLYAAEGSDLYFSEDGGENFLKVATLPTEIADIAIHHENPNIAWAVTSDRVGVPQAFQPTNRGVYKITVTGSDGEVEEITGNLPQDQAYFSIVHQGRHTDNPVYVGTSLGVYRLDDTRTEWEDYFTGLPSVAVSDLEISLDDEILTASTYGRGVWQSPIPVQQPDNDLRLLSVSPASGSILCTTDAIPQISVENKGLNSISQVAVSYRVNGGALNEFTETIDLASGATGTIDLPAINIGGAGEILLEVSATVSGDAFNENNDGQVRFFTNNTAGPNERNDFEDAADDLVAFNANGDGSEWERGVPQGEVLNAAASGTRVYGTNLDGDHADATKAFLLTPCYDFTSFLAPVLRFNMAYDLEVNFDIVYVEYSTDGGDTWNLLGSVDSQPNWYTSNRTNASSGAEDDCQNCPGAQWTGTDDEMKEYAYDFALNASLGETDLTAEANIVFRLVFHSDPAVTQEGVVVDDLGVSGLIDDEDDDDDGVLDENDNCPLTANAGQEDGDGDGIGDICDNDDDNDGVPDNQDNCPLTPNADQADQDMDGIGDVCDDDSDNDGVPNTADACPDTPQGTTVDTSGCEAFSLPTENFRVRTTGESCISSNNGTIRVEAVEALDYTATLTGDAGTFEESFTEAVTFPDLPAGSYQLCIGVVGQSGYEICFDTAIDQPEALSVSSQIRTLDQEVELELSGGTEYIIQWNGKTYRTDGGSIRLPIEKPSNELSVSTGLSCQGTYTETVVVSNTPLIYPNPVGNEDLNIYLGGTASGNAEIALYALSGTRVLAKRIPVAASEMLINMSGYPAGVYILNVRTGDSLRIYKIVKK